eukprot:CAMPEP_0194747838 /NCGR_PEP_ID=MMETSP0323_2-20130528/2039_1 /TAXON_ID=2866 ORGANISM="Crypthecodinium cohnii, Strain Seligo" /NCGR_SAMPLE_ID=MMETSP0323_2 /ASSEMBLY_ACC=CAM_ASM_000346 /LENGTH=132 /DNA_ID=CAMNT_0039661657 /DNA_START=316 /DNA_END=714 /DNA_ORIENTATION=+
MEVDIRLVPRIWPEVVRQPGRKDRQFALLQAYVVVVAKGRHWPPGVLESEQLPSRGVALLDALLFQVAQLLRAAVAGGRKEASSQCACVNMGKVVVARSQHLRPDEKPRFLFSEAALRDMLDVLVALVLEVL